MQVSLNIQNNMNPKMKRVSFGSLEPTQTYRFHLNTFAAPEDAQAVRKLEKNPFDIKERLGYYNASPKRQKLIDIFCSAMPEEEVKNLRIIMNPDITTRYSNRRRCFVSDVDMDLSAVLPIYDKQSGTLIYNVSKPTPLGGHHIYKIHGLANQAHGERLLANYYKRHGFKFSENGVLVHMPIATDAIFDIVAKRISKYVDNIGKVLKV